MFLSGSALAGTAAKARSRVATPTRDAIEAFIFAPPVVKAATAEVLGSVLQRPPGFGGFLTDCNRLRRRRSSPPKAANDCDSICELSLSGKSFMQPQRDAA